MRDLQRLRPHTGAGVHVLVSETSGPHMVQWSCGLGRVVLVGFDLDMAPFHTLYGQEGFIIFVPPCLEFMVRDVQRTS